MEGQESLQDVLAGSSAFAPQVESTPEPQPPVVEPKGEVKPEVKAEAQPETKPQERDEQGKFAKPKEEMSRRDVAAIIDERRKRQELEARLREMEAKQPEEKVSVFDDEDKAIGSRVSEQTRHLRESLFNQSMQIARLVYKDNFSEAENAFMEAAEGNPALYEGLRNSPNPGEYIYTVGLQFRELADVGGDFVKYREKVGSQYQTQLAEKDAQLAAMKAELEAVKQAKADLESIPRSLNNASSGAQPKPGQEDPEDLKAITRFGKK